MDRAHRLGQRRTVNVYRVLTRGTLEEKIMGLQRFKLDVAAAVVNSDNVSLSAMDTSKLLDLFAVQVRTCLPAKCCIWHPRSLMPRHHIWVIAEPVTQPAPACVQANAPELQHTSVAPHWRSRCNSAAHAEIRGTA